METKKPEIQFKSNTTIQVGRFLLSIQWSNKLKPTIEFHKNIYKEREEAYRKSILDIPPGTGC